MWGPRGCVRVNLGETLQLQIASWTLDLSTTIPYFCFNVNYAIINGFPHVEIMSDMHRGSLESPPIGLKPKVMGQHQRKSLRSLRDPSPCSVETLSQEYSTDSNRSTETSLENEFRDDLTASHESSGASNFPRQNRSASTGHWCLEFMGIQLSDDNEDTDDATHPVGVEAESIAQLPRERKCKPVSPSGSGRGASSMSYSDYLRSFPHSTLEQRMTAFKRCLGAVGFGAAGEGASASDSGPHHSHRTVSLGSEPTASNRSTGDSGLHWWHSKPRVEPQTYAEFLLRNPRATRAELESAVRRYLL
jgi:hypothetical protein